MKKLTTVFVALLILVLTFGLVACDKGGSGEADPTIAIQNLSGTGTEADPYLLSVQNGSEVKFTPVLSKTDLEFVAAAATGASNVELTVKDGKVTVKGKAVGTANVKVNIKDKEIAVFVKVTVTAKPVSAITFSALETGSGTIAAPYEASVRAGYTFSTPYLVAPTDADVKTITWTAGTVANGAFTAATDRGITAESNAANNAVTVTAAKTATVGDTYLKASSGAIDAYLKLAVTDVTARTDWTKSTFVSDWDRTNCAYNADNANNFEMPASSSIETKFAATAAKSALVVKAAKLDGETAIKVYADGTAISSLIGGESYAITSGKATALIYDLSGKIGNKVTIKIENAGANALVLTAAELIAMDNDATERTTWAKAEILSDWNLKGASQYRPGTGEGFDLNTNDSETYQYVYNNVAVTADTTRLAMKVRRFGQDEGRVAKALLTVDGVALTPVGYTSSTVDVQDVGKSSYLVYDLSEYVGDTVRVLFALVNDSIGHLVIEEVKLDEFDKTASERTSWTKDGDTFEIAEDWTIDYAGEWRNRGEGFSLNTFDNHASEFIYNYVPVTASNAKLFMKVRNFGAGNSVDSKAIVLVDGEALNAMGYVGGYATVYNVDGPGIQLVYDLTEYIGQTVQIAIMQPVANVGDFVIMNITMSAWEAVEASDLTSWDKATIETDWNITYASEYRDGVGEGFDLNTNDNDANEFIYNDIAVTENRNSFEIKVRRFGQDEGRVNAVGVLVDGVLLVAEGKTDGYNVVEDNGDSTIYKYDLSAYVGKTVRIVVIQPVPKTGHLVIESMELPSSLVD